ncbi:MAG TPA: DUF1464 family protein [Gemmatimonadales bacterium]|nr:DUF1464 family protein [Gemmatimonadales bacterium]
MTRVVGIDPGTVSIDVCGTVDGQLYLDRSWPTEEALAHPEGLIEFLTQSGSPDLIAGPSGYGLPLLRSADATEPDLRLAFLAAPEEPGGIGGLRGLAKRLGASGLPVVYTPGVMHLDTVPDHRKINRVDLGTADKVCAAVLGIQDQARRLSCSPEAVSFILIELGGAFTAAVAVERGQIVDGIGGTSGPIGWHAAGALDGEVAFLAGRISKAALFQGGVSSLIQRDPARTSMAREAYLEGAAKAVRQLRCSAPSARDILLSGRHAADPEIQERLRADLVDLGAVRTLTGFAAHAKQGAQGAALLADGLAGGRHADMVSRLRIREARGTVLDHLAFITPAAARQRLGLSGND